MLVLTSILIFLAATQYNKLVFDSLLPFIELEIGTPGQIYRLLVDTGSSRTLIPCVDYLMERSQTKQTVDCDNSSIGNRCSSCNFKKQCLFSQKLIDGSEISGYYIKDRVKFGQNIQNMSIPDLSIGCVNDITQVNQRNQYLGYLGLIHQNNNYFPNLVDSITNDNNRSFSICFNTKDPFIFIGNNYLNSSQSIKYSSDKANNFYQIQVNEITSQSFQINQSKLRTTNLYIDSGTDSIVIGDQMMYSQFKEHFNQYVNRNFLIEERNNYSCVKQQNNLQNFFNTFPTYVFSFENKLEYIWEPKNYLSPEHNDYYCFRIEYLPGLDGILLGTPWMIGYEFTFDQNNQSIRFQNDCSYQKISLSTEPQSITPKSNSRVLIIIVFAAVLVILIILCYYSYKRTRLQRALKKPQIELSES